MILSLSLTVAFADCVSHVIFSLCEVQESPEPSAKRPCRDRNSPGEEMTSPTQHSPVVQSDYFGCSFKNTSSRGSDQVDHVARLLQSFRGMTPEHLERAIHPKDLFSQIASEEQIRQYVLNSLDTFHESATCPDAQDNILYTTNVECNSSC